MKKGPIINAAYYYNYQYVNNCKNYCKGSELLVQTISFYHQFLSVHNINGIESSPQFQSPTEFHLQCIKQERKIIWEVWDVCTLLTLARLIPV